MDLGVQWLSQLGPTTTDYTTRTISFLHNKKHITLTCFHSPVSPNQISLHQLKRLQSTNSITYYFQLQLDPITPTDPHDPFETSHPQIKSILSKFTHLFNKPIKPPPHRERNHHINLQHNSQPINVKPYRYPYFQKNEIETQVRDMLKSQIIQPSTSPFSSPVLLVKKKDGS